MATYFELLKHPKWQRKRLEIMTRADFTCQRCKSKDKTLHIHHQYYEKGLNPWEYPSSSLQCVCEECHVIVQENMALLTRLIGALPSPSQETLFGFASALSSKGDDTFHVPSFEIAVGVAYYFGVGPMAILSLASANEYRLSPNLINQTLVDGSR